MSLTPELRLDAVPVRARIKDDVDDRRRWKSARLSRLWLELTLLLLMMDVVVAVVLTLLRSRSVVGDMGYSGGVDVGAGPDGRRGDMVEDDGSASDVGLDRRVVPRLLERTVLAPEDMYSNAR